MFCRHCGAELAEAQPRCDRCGEQAEPAAATRRGQPRSIAPAAILLGALVIGGLALLAVLRRERSEAPWPSLRGPQPTGQSRFSGPQRPTAKWKLQTGADIWSTPVVSADGSIYLGSNDGRLYAISPRGEVKWKVALGRQVKTTPALSADGTIYAGGDDGSLYALSPDGKVRWRAKLAEGALTSPAPAPDGSIVVGCDDWHIYAVSPQGKLKWKAKTGWCVTAAPAVHSDGTVYAGSWDKSLYAFSPSGRVKWSMKTGGMLRATPALAPDGMVYFGSDDGLYAVTSEGQLTWKAPLDGAADSSPAIAADGTIYVGSSTNLLYAVTPAGKLRWKVKLGGAASSPIIGGDGTIYIGATNGLLYAVTPEGKLKWRLKTGGAIFASPAISAEGLLLLGAGNGYLYAIGESQPAQPAADTSVSQPEANEAAKLALREGLPRPTFRPGRTDATSIGIKSAVKLRPTVPTVSGLSERLATELLADRGLTVQVMWRNSQVPSGRAIRTLPPAGKRVAPGTEVVLLMSRGLQEEAAMSPETASFVPRRGTGTCELRVGPPPQGCSVLVYVDGGRPRGKAPCSIALSPGNHAVALWDPKHKQQLWLTVKLRRGQSRLLSGRVHR